jgi:hypothetical protein
MESVLLEAGTAGGMRHGPRVALLCLLLLAVAAPQGAVGQPAAGAAVQEGNSLTAESTTLTVQLRADGDAEWTVSTGFVLDDANDTRAFDRLKADFRAGNADVAYDVSAFEAAAAAASEETGREMRIESVRFRNETVRQGDQRIGRLVLQFRWTNFAEESGDRIRVGDAFNTTSGTWLPGLTSRQTLIVEPPSGYAVFDSPPDVGPEQGRLTWEGPTTFEPGYLSQITYAGTTPTQTATPTPGDDGPNLGTVELVGGGLLLFAALALGGYVLARRDDDPFDGDAPATTDSGGGDTPDAPAGPATTDQTAGAEPAVEESDDDEPDWDLLSDEERVEYLLEENGGRMKQASIVEETGWSNAKVSQLLSAMDEAGRVDKLRIGRENLISLPDEEVAEVGDGEE